MKRLTLMLTVAATVFAAACGSSSKPASSGQATPTSSVPKISTVVLLTHSSFATSPNVLEDFTKQTGYKVKLLQPGDAGVVVNQAILRKDHPDADAIFGVDNTFLTRALDAGIFDPYTPKGADQVPGLQPDPQHRVTTIDSGNVCVIYDKSWFAKSGRPAVPSSLDDLVAPAYKKLTVVENASTSSPGLAFLLATIAAKGDNGWQDYWKALKANGVRVVDDWTQAYQSDFTAGGGSGDRPIVVSYGSDPVADIVYSKPHHDTPAVGVVEPTCFRQNEFVGVLHNAHNVPGAQALVDFMLSKVFQSDMPLQMYVNPIVPGAQIPDVYRRWAVVPKHPLTMSTETIGAHRDEWIKQWTDLVVR